MSRSDSDDEANEKADEEVVVPASLAHSLPRGSPVSSSSAILITTSFSHWIRWRAKIEGAALLVSPGPYPKVTRPRCTFLAALRHLDLAATTTANYVSSALNERQMKTADWRSSCVISRSCEDARNKTQSTILASRTRARASRTRLMDVNGIFVRSRGSDSYALVLKPRFIPRAIKCFAKRSSVY